ncbi:MAG: phage Gp37/Gp68 family protein [Gemmatimonadota bacterium]|nr:phage Gp37/Gp68 family protein [Gemmatimonadota bacterium]
MGNRTGIEWTNMTWNPVTGCTQVSAGCDNCYALTLANRLLREHYTQRQPQRDNPQTRRDPFAVRLWPDRLDEPLSWHRSQRVFVNSMGDLFHVDVPDNFVRAVFGVMLETPQHLYQILTKRPSRMARFVNKHRALFPDTVVPPHIWLGTSIEDERVAYRAEHLRQVNAVVRFLSCEPLLGPLRVDLQGIHWVIAGGESGIHYRPLNLDWVRQLRDDCLVADVPFFFKQVGGRTPKAGGRTLDGRTWDQYPDVKFAVLA